MFAIYFFTILGLGIVSYLSYDRFRLKSINDNLESEKDKLLESINSLNKRVNSVKPVLDNNIKNDLNNEIKNIQTKIEGLKYSLITKQNEYNRIVSNIDNKNKEYEQLLKKIDNFEDYDMSSYGLYKPIFNFDTSEDYRDEITSINDDQKLCVQYGNAVICQIQWSVGGSQKDGDKLTKQYSKLMLKAFNGECDSAISKVRWDNFYRIEQRIRKAFEDINKLGKTYSISITEEYLKLKIDELRLTYEYKEKKYQEKEEQRRIQEQIREEEKVQKEIEETLKQAEKEERQFQDALEKAKKEVYSATGKKLEELNNKILIYEQRIKDSIISKERAISRAQLTKSGFVYVISNIGAFGENVYKIGMTRRLEPFDRIKELSGASVPFSFDLHCMIYSDNAPELERKLHILLDKQRVNLINNRKEFFKINKNELKKAIKEYDLEVDFIDEAEAREYRESLALLSHS